MVRLPTSAWQLRLRYRPRLSNISCVEIADSARRHGIADADIRHAMRMPMRYIRQSNDRVLVLAPDRNGRILELVVLDATDDEDEVVIHAMPMRPKFQRFL